MIFDATPYEGDLSIIINRTVKYHILPLIDVQEREILLIKIQANLNLIVGAYVTLMLNSHLTQWIIFIRLQPNYRWLFQRKTPE